MPKLGLKNKHKHFIYPKYFSEPRTIINSSKTRPTPLCYQKGFTTSVLASAKSLGKSLGISLVIYTLLKQPKLAFCQILCNIRLNTQF